MRLKKLVIQLASKPLPAETPAKAVWLINCPEKKGVDFAGAIALAECELTDEFRPYDRRNGRNENGNDYFIGSTAYLAGSVAHLTPEEIDRDWESICKMMNWRTAADSIIWSDSSDAYEQENKIIEKALKFADLLIRQA